MECFFSTAFLIYTQRNFCHPFPVNGMHTTTEKLYFGLFSSFRVGVKVFKDVFPSKTWSYVGQSLYPHMFHLPECTTARLSSLHRHPCLLPAFHVFLVSGPESNSTTDCTKDAFVFSVISAFAWDPLMLLQHSIIVHTMTACLFIWQFPALPSLCSISTKRNSLKELSAFSLSEGENKFNYFLHRRLNNSSFLR